ncbi:MAG: uL4 family ribosomal protein [Candidatus Hodgkinia cicadicola]
MISFLVEFYYEVACPAAISSVLWSLFNLDQIVLMKTLLGHDVTVFSVNFKIYPRYDVISDVVRWQLDKRRWHVSQIKSRADVSCSSRKKYNQKGSGDARHATPAVCQFRGGGKYAAKKVCKRTRLNKKLKILALRSCLSLKTAENNLFVLDSISQFRLVIVNKPLLVYYNNNELKMLPFKKITFKFRCVQWFNLSVLQIMSTRELLFTRRALESLDAKLTDNK